MTDPLVVDPRELARALCTRSASGGEPCAAHVATAEAVLATGVVVPAARVEAVADWCAEQEAEVHAAAHRDAYAEGARYAYDLTEQRIRAALTPKGPADD